MRKFKNYIKAIFFLLIAFYSQYTIAQSVLPDTVYSNEEITTEIKLPFTIQEARWISTKSSYDLTYTDKSVIINGAKMKNAKSDVLQITANNREFTFVVVYREVINPPNITDLSTTKKLDQHYKDLAARSSNKPFADKKINPQKHTEDKKDLIDKSVAVDNEKVKEAQEDLVNKKYLPVINEANSLFNQKNYIKARDRYQQATSIKPGDRFATAQIEKIDKIIQDEELKKQLNTSAETYKTLIQNADKAYNDRDFSSAKALYTQALTYKPGDPTATSRIKLIEDKEKQNKATTDLENNYKNAMSEGDKYLAVGDLENAKLHYNKAYGFIKRTEPQDQIKKINKLISDNAANVLAENKRLEKEKQDKILAAVENNYRNAMSEGDKYLAIGDLENAKLQYNKAYGFIKRPEPQDQIKKINKLISDNAAQKLAENKRVEKEKENNSRYQKLIEAADTEFKKQNYAKAKQLFASASAFKPSEQYPRDMITKTDIALTQIEADKKAKADNEAKERATHKLYSAAISKGKSYYQKGDFINAKAAYTEAANLKPTEDEPGKQIAVINQKIADEEIVKQLNDQYEAKLKIGEGLLITALKVKTKESLQLALTAFNEASKVKPNETYPLQRIKYIRTEIQTIESAAIKKETTDKFDEENKAYANAVQRGRDAQFAKKYDEALEAYKEAQSMRYNKDIEDIINNIEDYMKRNNIKPSSDKKKKGKKK